MRDLSTTLPPLLTEIDAYLAGKYFSLRVEFWGAHYQFRRVSLVTAADAFGTQGGAEVGEKQRIDKRAGDDATSRCAFPLEVIARDETYSKYALLYGDSKLEKCATKFIHLLTDAHTLMSTYASFLTLHPEPYCMQARAGNGTFLVGLTRVIPKKVKRRKRDAGTIEDLEIW